MNCWRKPQEAFITLKNIQAHNIMRRKLMKFTFGFVPIVLVSGFFVAGISGGTSCNTYPMVGSSYFISKKHLHADIPLWQNFTENKLVAQVNHRTLATFMTILATYQIGSYLRGASTLTRSAKFASAFLVLALWSQLGVGVKTIWESVPIHMASTHQIGSMTVLTAFVLTMHTCRRVD